MRHERFDPFCDIRLLSASRRAALKQNFVRRAHAARAEAMRRSFAHAFGLIWRSLSVAMQAIAEVIRRVWAAYRCRRDRLEGLAQLRAMTDYELRDIGLSRSGISRAALSEEKDTTLRRQ
jgi:uncharacterized protein YjiS (DUF1127 family)